jgi:hypothetical protein
LHRAGDCMRAFHEQLRDRTLRNIDHDNVRIFDGFDSDDVRVFDRGAITRVKPYAIDVDGARRKHQICAPSFAKGIFDRLAGREQGSKHAGAVRMGSASVSDASSHHRRSLGTIGRAAVGKELGE